MRFIKEFADRFHHDKEEKILFAAAQKQGVLTHCNPIPQMLHEHEEARALVGKMESAIEGRRAVDFCRAATDYASLLKDHIFKEDQILYPMCERGLKPEAKVEILEQYAAAEKSRGANFVAACHALVEDISRQVAR